jgi:hypothetical protein
VGIQLLLSWGVELTLTLTLTVNWLVLQHPIGLLYEPLVTDKCAALVELRLPEATKVFSCSSQVPYEISWEGTKAFTVRRRQMTPKLWHKHMPV